jgi:hypothetical protein
MQVEHHPLISEFPEHRAKIHALKGSNDHFARLADRYEVLDKQIVRAEDGIEPCADALLENLKKQRLALKDDLYGILSRA